MARLTASQLANALNVSVYTIKRWYKWYETEDKEKIEELKKKGMPELPAYETVGNMNWKFWEGDAVEQLKKFQKFIPNTRGGFMGSLNKKEEK